MLDQRFAWNNKVDFPRHGDKPTGMKATIVHKADAAFPFLHDTMVVPLLGKIFMAWYNCSEAEIVGRTVIRGCWSDDGGEHWSIPEIIAEDVTEGGLHYVPVTFHEFEGKAYAYITIMKSHDRPLGYECRVYETGLWNVVKKYEDPLLFNTLIQELPNGMIAAAGRIASRTGELPLIPSVMLAEKQEPATWRIQRLPGPWLTGDYSLPYPETALLIQDGLLTAIVRGEEKAEAYFSQNQGIDWEGPYDTGLPVAGSKMYGGMLSNGIKYFIFNQRTDTNDRSRLVMIIQPKDKKCFTRLYVLQEGYNKKLDAGPYWHYPCACEYKNILFISCTSSSEEKNVRHGILFRIPIENL